MADARRIGLDEVVRHFEELEAPRSSVNRKYPLVSVPLGQEAALSVQPHSPHGADRASAGRPSHVDRERGSRGGHTTVQPSRRTRRRRLLKETTAPARKPTPADPIFSGSDFG
jgi:hypothetical protein